MKKNENVEIIENEENVKNEIVSVEKEEVALFGDIQQKVYCSKVVETKKDKKELFNALESCDVLINDCVGQEILIKDVYCEEKNVLDDTTGEIKTKYRTIIFDANGQTYATGSYGIYNVLKKLFAIYGLPTEWEEPLKVKVAKRPIKDGKQSLTLTLI